MDEICSQLWCLVNDECVTQLRPAAGGTNCGRHKVRTLTNLKQLKKIENLTNHFVFFPFASKVVSKPKMCGNRGPAQSD